MLSNAAPVHNKENDQKSWNETSSSLKWHQFHLWVGFRDFAFLEKMAKEQEESVARIIRRLIRQYRQQVELTRR